MEHKAEQLVQVVQSLVLFAGLELENRTTSGLASQFAEHLALDLCDVCVGANQEFVARRELEAFKQYACFGNNVLADKDGVATAAARTHVQRMAVPEIQNVQDAFNHVVFGKFIGAFHAKVCIRVILFAFLEHHLDFFEAFFVAQVGKQRTRVLAADTFRKYFGLCPQANDGAVFADDLEVVRLRECTAAQRNNVRSFFLGKFGDDVAFHFAELGFAVLFKDFADGLACAFDDNGVCIYVGAV